MSVNEGRRSPRVTPPDVIEGRTHFDTSVHVIDLSAAGALVECDRPVPAGARLRLDLDVGDGRPLLSLRARVVRASHWDGGRFRLGLQFDDLPAEQRGRLTNVVDREARLERRSTPRIFVGNDAQLTKEVALEVVNLGLFGGLFRLDAPLEFESHHDFVFTLPQGEVRARGLVRHCEAWAGPGPEPSARFRLGVEFTELEGMDRDRVVQYLEAQGQNPAPGDSKAG